MKLHKLDTFQKGWFIGNFEPTLYQNNNVEVAIKRYKSGDDEHAHYHKVATEWTCIVEGRISMNDRTFEKDDIIEVTPGEIVKFRAIEDTVTVVIKSPSVKNDKYII